MDLRKEIESITNQIDDIEKLKSDSQKLFREYVTNKIFPLDDRFQIWKKYCEKEEHDCCIYESEYGAIGKLAEDYNNKGYLNRGRKYDYEWLLGWASDYIRYDCDYNKVPDSERYFANIDEFTEQLIEYNFGSFTYDW